MMNLNAGWGQENGLDYTIEELSLGNPPMKVIEIKSICGGEYLRITAVPDPSPPPSGLTFAKPSPDFVIDDIFLYPLPEKQDDS